MFYNSTPCTPNCHFPIFGVLLKKVEHVTYFIFLETNFIWENLPFFHRHESQPNWKWPKKKIAFTYCIPKRRIVVCMCVCKEKKKES